MSRNKSSILPKNLSTSIRELRLKNLMQYQDWSRKRAYNEDNFAGSTDRNMGISMGHRVQPGYASSDTGPSQPKRGRGKPTSFLGETPFAPTTEHRIPVDVNVFPADSNIIMQLLGPRGKHQQRMKNESDSIVTTSGKIMRGGAIPGEEPLSLVIRSKDPSVPLTHRQVAIVYQIYEDIIRHVKEFGNSDNAATGPLNVNHIAPMSLIEFLWNLHILLSRPRAQDLTVDELYESYFEMFNQECPLASWLVVDPGSGGVYAALRRIPHVVEQYQTKTAGPWFIRASNPPNFSFSQLREVDDAYKIRLQQIAAGQIPIEDLADSSGITGMLFGLDRVTACVNVLQAIVKILLEKSKGITGLDLGALELEFHELFKVPLDVFHLLSQRSLLQFLAKFRPLFNLYNDGISWKILLQEGWDMAVSNMENLVRTTILVQPKERRVVRLSGLILPPVKSQHVEHTQSSSESSNKPEGDSVAALVSLLQGFQKPPAAPAAEPTNTVTAQIQQLLQKKKQQAEQPITASAASGNALNELMAALQAAKTK